MLGMGRRAPKIRIRMRVFEKAQSKTNQLHSRSSRRVISSPTPGGEMLTEIKYGIMEHLVACPDSNTREVNEAIPDHDRSTVYSSLCELERKGAVRRKGGLDGTTITFIWNLR